MARTISGFYESVVVAGKAVTEIEHQFSDGDTEIFQITAHNEDWRTTP